MRIRHRITLNVSGKIRLELEPLGILIKEGLSTFEVTETDPVWPQLIEILKREQAVDITSTEFTIDECTSADWLKAEPQWHHGYPQPEDSYLTATYDLSNYCGNCGIGAIQSGPFKMVAEPKWGRREVLQLHWIYGEYFAKPDAWEKIFHPQGIDAIPVLHAKSGQPLHTVVQLKNQGVAESKLDIGSFAHRYCSRCERRKYLPVTRGFFPPFLKVPSSGAMLRTQEWFGDGASAHQAVTFSQTLWRQLTENSVLGLSCVPMR